MSSPRILQSILVLVLLVTSGCGNGQRAGVSGKVTLDGEPIEKGLIRFTPLAGTEAPSAGSAINQGTYSLPADNGLMPGRYRVEINCRGLTGRKVAAGPKGPMIDEVIDLVPKRYNADSELILEIQSDSRVVDYDLKSK